MATSRVYVCTSCGGKRPAPLLFKALYDAAHIEHSKILCSACDAQCQLELKFAFGLGAGSRTCRVLDAFLPDQDISWQSDNSAVTFYPFLVVVEASEERSIWLPDWHVVKDAAGSTKTKYGQWAPFVGMQFFASLIQKARAKGYSL